MRAPERLRPTGLLLPIANLLQHPASRALPRVRPRDERPYAPAPRSPPAPSSPSALSRSSALSLSSAPVCRSRSIWARTIRSRRRMSDWCRSGPAEESLRRPHRYRFQPCTSDAPLHTRRGIRRARSPPAKANRWLPPQPLARQRARILAGDSPRRFAAGRHRAPVAWSRTR